MMLELLVEANASDPLICAHCLFPEVGDLGIVVKVGVEAGIGIGQNLGLFRDRTLLRNIKSLF